MCKFYCTDFSAKVNLLFNVIKSLPKGNFIGPDGFSKEYDQIFGEHFAPHLAIMYKTAAAKAYFPLEMQRAHIVTFPNQEKNHIPRQILGPSLSLNRTIKYIIQFLPTVRRPSCLN